VVVSQLQHLQPRFQHRHLRFLLFSSAVRFSSVCTAIIRIPARSPELIVVSEPISPNPSWPSGSLVPCCLVRRFIDTRPFSLFWRRPTSGRCRVASRVVPPGASPKG
jgi:hypothetical protein